jgi:hypothetical protein
MEKERIEKCEDCIYRIKYNTDVFCRRYPTPILVGGEPTPIKWCGEFVGKG